MESGWRTKTRDLQERNDNGNKVLTDHSCTLRGPFPLNFAFIFIALDSLRSSISLEEELSRYPALPEILQLLPDGHHCLRPFTHSRDTEYFPYINPLGCSQEANRGQIHLSASHWNTWKMAASLSVAKEKMVPWVSTESRFDLSRGSLSWGNVSSDQINKS